MPKYFFFDLDDTLTPSRSEMDPSRAELFEKLCRSYEVIVVSGAEEKQMRAQLPKDKALGMYTMLTQNGNHAIAKDGSVLWSESFNAQQEAAIYAFIEKLKVELALTVSHEEDLVEHRGSQISYSTIGHHEDREKKRAYDPGGASRKANLANHPDDVAALKKLDVDVVVAGTTCFDFFLSGKNKGYHIARLLEHNDWLKTDSIYVGDALEPGRNDESVIGVIPTKAVAGPDETFDFIAQMLH